MDHRGEAMNTEQRKRTVSREELPPLSEMLEGLGKMLEDDFKKRTGLVKYDGGVKVEIETPMDMICPGSRMAEFKAEFDAKITEGAFNQRCKVTIEVDFTGDDCWLTDVPGDSAGSQHQRTMQ